MENNYKENLNKTISQIFESRYIIPLYQRNFAWRREQIETLLRDVYESYRKDHNSHYFIGSLVVMKRTDDDFEVIDGQQRLTTLSIVAQILGISKEQRLTYDSRPYVEDFFRELYARHSVFELQHPSVFYLKEAVNIIKNVNLREDSEGGERITLCDEDGTLNKDVTDGFTKYFANNVILVRVEIPEETDVASYFEIMNNRGEQLQEHEILKSLMMAEIKGENTKEYDLSKQQEFAMIWDACSQMDEPIQKLFNTDRRKAYFGDKYDDFNFAGLTSGNIVEKIDGYTIDEILNDAYKPQETAETSTNADVDDLVDESKYTTIIDFPNFLMHVFKAFYDETYTQKFENEEIPLDAKYLLRTYERLKKDISSEKFISQLFRSRAFFDRYVVKTVENPKDEEDGISWSLKKPKLDKSKTYFVNTFGQSDEQERIVKALTMLQVTFRNRKYKNWLNTLLRWFAGRPSIQITPSEYINELDDIILNYYEEKVKIGDDFTPIGDESRLTRENSYSLGVKTPHFIFNFIDYLYWVESKNQTKHDIKYTDIISDFDFKYWSSVEHHLAQNNVKDDGRRYVDNLGNLCLISKGTNSRLSDRDVKEKVLKYNRGNLGANRQIIYKITETGNYEWNEYEIKDHYNDLLDLISKREQILSITAE